MRTLGYGTMMINGNLHTGGLQLSDVTYSELKALSNETTMDIDDEFCELLLSWTTPDYQHVITALADL